MVTNSRTTLRSPISSRVGSPLVLQVLGRQADRAEREEVVVARRSWCRRRSRRATSSDGARAEPHLRARRRSRARPARPAPSTAPGRHARGGIDLRARAASATCSSSVRLRHAVLARAHLAAHAAERARAGAAPAPRGGAGRRAPPAGGTWRRRCRPRGPRARPGSGASCSSQMPGRLGQALHEQHARHHRRAREVALEELLGAGDVLDGHERPAGSCSSTRSTSTNGYWLGIWRISRAMSMAALMRAAGSPGRDRAPAHGVGAGAGVRVTRARPAALGRPAPGPARPGAWRAGRPRRLGACGLARRRRP